MVRVVKEAAAPWRGVREGSAPAEAEGPHQQWLKAHTGRWLPCSVTRPSPLPCSASPAAPRASGSPPTAAGWLRRGPAGPVPPRKAGAGVAHSPLGRAVVHSALPKHQQGNAVPAPGITDPRLCPKQTGGKRNEALKAE